MSPSGRLFRVELPLAVPVIAAGARTALVLAVATVPLGANLGAGGLGFELFGAIKTSRPVALFAISLFIAVLALLVGDWGAPYWLAFPLAMLVAAALAGGVEAGVVRRLVHGGDHAHYELAEELTEHHHHLICESCGVVRDFTLGGPIERMLDQAFADVAAGTATLETFRLPTD